MIPLKFSAHKIETIWGYENWILSAIKGRESFLCKDIAKSLGFAENEDVTLNSLIERYGEELLGKRVVNKFGNRFPILIKYINTVEQLSVQVHPSDKVAAQINSQKNSETKEEFHGKTESWYILGAQNDTELISGFNIQLSKEEFKKIVEDSIADSDALKGEERIECVLQKYLPRKGDFYFIPSGTVHSLGAGLEVLEIQGSADTTFRLYDFNRKDKDGNLRRLDIEDAFLSIDFSKVSEEKSAEKLKSKNNVFDLGAAICKVADCEYFTSDYIDLSKVCRSKCGSENFYHLDLSMKNSFAVICCTDGDGIICYRDSYNNQKENQIAKDDLILLPYGLGSVDIFSKQNLKFIETYIR